MTAHLPRFCVRIEHGDAPRHELISAQDRVVIGRSPDADLVIEDADVSPLHCEITRDQGGFILRDLGSERGTWLSGVRVREVVLPPEAYFELGSAGVFFGCTDEGKEPPLHPEDHFGELLGESAVMRAVFARLARIAAGDTPVLLEGESGTGKELAARAVHAASSRKTGPFVVVDCGSSPRALVEAELFGDERGASPGSAGALLGAAGGSVLLDEIGELDIELQQRLLGVLERREVQRLGAPGPVLVDVRVMAATSQDLRRRVVGGAFRGDLYERLAVGRVRLPPLRERRADIPLLVRHFVRQHSARDAAEDALDEELVRRLGRRPWPGNVRQLRSAVEQILALGVDDVPVPESPRAPVTIDVPFKSAKAKIVSAFELEYLTAMLARQNGNITASANAAQLDRVHFLRLLDRYGLRKTKVTSRPPKT